MTKYSNNQSGAGASKSEEECEKERNEIHGTGIPHSLKSIIIGLEPVL